MSELLRSRHAFGSLANVDAAIDQGLIDAYDILFLNEGKIGWIDKDGNKVILEEKKRVVTVEALPKTGEKDIVYICGTKFYFWDGEKFTSPEDLRGMSEEEVDVKLDKVETKIVNNVNAYTDGRIETTEKIKFEVVGKPVGTLVNYGDKEIRVMCPKDTAWEKQNVGATGNSNIYYMEFRAYAPEGAVSFKEGDRGVIIDKMFTFDDDFAGTDEHGRNYSVCWLALALYDESNGTWKYYGEDSSVSKYVGWTYVVEWYDKDGVKLAHDFVRINLANEECYDHIEPYYINGTLNAANEYTDKQIARAITVIEF